MNRKIGLVAVSLIAVLLPIIVVTSSCECGPPQNINVEIIAPLHVAKGEEFTFEVRVKNTASKPHLLYTIDIWDEYMEGIFVQKTEPPFMDCYHIPVDNTQCYEFNKDIQANSELAIKFYAVGIEPGNYSSYLDVCIGKGGSFASYPILTIVED